MVTSLLTQWSYCCITLSHSCILPTLIFHPITSVSSLCYMTSEPVQYQQVSFPSAWGELQVICSLIVAIPHIAGQPIDLMDPHILAEAADDLCVEKQVYLQLWFQIFWVQNYSAVMLQHSPLSPKSSHKTLHSLPVRASYGVCFVGSTLIYILPKFLGWCMQYHIILCCIKTALDCSLSALAITMNTFAKYAFDHISRLPEIVWKCPFAVIQFMSIRS